MAAKKIVFTDEVREKIKNGVSKLTAAVKCTLGPCGRNVILDKSFGAPVITKDGVTVAEEIELIDPYENMGATMVKEVAAKTNAVAGDGTTTATVLAEAIFRQGLKSVVAGVSPISMKSGIDKAIDAVLTELDKKATKVRGDFDAIANVGAISANNEQAIGDMISDAMQKVSEDGVITVEEGKGLENEVDVVEGMQFDRGYLSPAFMTDIDKMVAELESPMILIYEEKISNIQDLVPVMEKVAKENKSLFIVAEDIEGEALSTMVVNNLKKVLKCCAVKAPGYGDRRKEMLKDIATLTGAKVVSKDLGVELKDVDASYLGTAKTITVDKDNTTIVEGAGKRNAIKDRITSIRREIETTTSDYDKEKLQERLAKLAGGVAVIKVGGATEVEMKERKDRVEDALHSTRAAVEEGIVVGGGVALIRAATAIDKLDLSDEEKIGAAIITSAIELPLISIAQNAGQDGDVIVSKVKKAKGNIGYNARTDAFEDLTKAGVIDPVKVTKQALVNAASVASLLLTTDAMIAEIKDDSDAGMPDMGGMGGMGGGMPGMGGMGGMPGMM